MTRKHASMLSNLLALLASQPLRDWTSALSEVNPEITAQDILLLKKRLKSATNSSRSTRASVSRPNNTIKERSLNFTEEGLLRGLMEEYRVKSSSPSRAPNGEEFGRWMKIIAKKHESPVVTVKSKEAKGSRTP